MKYEGFVTPITEGGGGGCLGCLGGLILVGIVVYGIITGEIRLPFSSGSQPTSQSTSTPQARPKPRTEKNNPSVSNPPVSATVVNQRYDIPSIRADVTAIKFFNSGSSIGNKVYQSRFAKSEARYINWELNLKHPAPGTRTCFNIEAVYYGPDNRVFGTQTKETCLEASWTSSYHNTGKGWNEPGMWQAGTYKVELSVEHKLIANGSFEVYEDARAVQPLTPAERPVPNPQPSRNDDNRPQHDEMRSKPDKSEILIRGAQKVLEEIRKRRRN